MTEIEWEKIWDKTVQRVRQEAEKSAKLKKPSRTCLVCEKPFKGKTQLCPSCRKRCNFTDRFGDKKPIAIGVVLEVKRRYPGRNPFDVIEHNRNALYAVFRETTRADRNRLRVATGAKFRGAEYLNAGFSRWDTIPPYVKAMFEKDASKKLLYIEGSKDNPDIYYICKRCGKEQCQKYRDLANGNGHNCESVKSSGEAVVEDFLKRRRIPYLTQRQTLKCVNPKTGAALPYDFEIPQAKLIIEVQGNQHFHYIPYFHGSVENFEYGQWKDDYKRKYAEKCGYRVLYVNYEDISNGRYASMILTLLH